MSTAACILQDKTHRPGVSVALDVEMLGDDAIGMFKPLILWCGCIQSARAATHTCTYLHTSTNHTTTAPGAKVRLTTWADRIGKTLAFLRLQLRDALSGRLVAVGKHCKYLPMGIPFWDAAFNPGLYPLLRCVLFLGEGLCGGWVRARSD